VLRGRLHSRGRDRQAIHHHYDLSNEFYALILDPHMAYSCGYWRSDDPTYTVEDAQRDKLELVCRKVGLGAPGMRFLDVGCGWGSLSLYAAEHLGAQVTGVTIAPEQKRFIDERIRERGLEDRVEIRLQDYREITGGPFDAVALLEMGEHVGQRNYGTYVKALRDNVVPGGRVLIQQMSRRGATPEAVRSSSRSSPRTCTCVRSARPSSTSSPAASRSGTSTPCGSTTCAPSTPGTAPSRTTGTAPSASWARRSRACGGLYLVGGSMAFRDGRMGVDQILAVRPSDDGDSSMPPVRLPEWS
jgi:cyclopropane-fatty-acyl-phospholipid synthase